MCAQVYVSARVAYTLHTCANLLVGVCGKLMFFYVHLKNLFMVNWPRAKVPTTDVPLRAHTAYLQGLDPKKSQPEQLLERGSERGGM